MPIRVIDKLRRRKKNENPLEAPHNEAHTHINKQQKNEFKTYVYSPLFF